MLEIQTSHNNYRSYLNGWLEDAKESYFVPWSSMNSIMLKSKDWINSIFNFQETSEIA